MLKVGETNDNFQELNENQQKKKNNPVPVKVRFCLGFASASVLLRYVIIFDKVKRHEEGDRTRLCLKAQRVCCVAVFNDLNVFKPSCWPTVKSSGISEISMIASFLIQLSVGNIHRTVVWVGHAEVSPSLLSRVRLLSDRRLFRAGKCRNITCFDFDFQLKRWNHTFVYIYISAPPWCTTRGRICTIVWKQWSNGRRNHFEATLAFAIFWIKAESTDFFFCVTWRQ